MKKLSHVDEDGKARMVDISEKTPTARKATARARVRMEAATLRLIRENGLEKGDVLNVARIAGIMAAKNTSTLIPMCHPLPLSAVRIEFAERDGNTIEIIAETRVHARTGVEMEALTAAAVASLTLYDMCKAVDRGMVIEEVRVLEKSGGESGEYRAEI